MRRIQRFEVSLKAFLRRGEKALFLRERDTGYWELPGGRIEVGEEALEHSAILLREIAEELGIPLGTVKTRTLAALRKLRTALKEDDT